MIRHIVPSRQFDHGPLTRCLLPLLIPQRVVKSIVLLAVIFTTVLAGRMEDGGSVAAAPWQAATPTQPAVPTINVRVRPASPTVMSATITMVVATTMTVGVLIQTLALQQNLVPDRIRLLFNGRTLGADEVIADIPRFRDGFTLILQYLGPAVAAVGTAAAAVGTAANQALGAVPNVGAVAVGPVDTNGLPLPGSGLSRANLEATGERH